MAESSLNNQIQFYDIDLPNRFGENIGKTLVLIKKYYRLKVTEDQFDRLFGNHEFIVSSVYNEKETYKFDNREMAALCGQRLSMGGASIVTMRHKNYEDGSDPLVILCVFFNGRIVTYNRVSQGISKKGRIPEE